jgi:hypothetical protein
MPTIRGETRTTTAHHEERRHSPEVGIGLPMPTSALEIGAPQPVRPVGDEPALHEVVVNRLSRTVPALVAVGDPASPDQP